MAILINWWALLVTTVVSIISGFLWFGPVFGKAWLKTMNIEMPKEITPEMRKQMNKSYSIVAIGALIMNFILWQSLTLASFHFFDVSPIQLGIMVAFFNWLGFIAPVTVGSVLWEGRPWKYWAITSGYWLFVLIVNAIIYVSWM